MKHIKARHIDNSFFRLSSSEARALCWDGKLPADGYEKRAIPADKLNSILVRMIRSGPYTQNGRGWVEFGKPISENAKCWITRTPLGWHDGKPVESGWVWAIYVWEPITASDLPIR